MECAILFMREQVYNYGFVYRDGCHVCRSPLGKTNDINQDEYMFQGPHHVKGMTIMYSLENVILKLSLQPQPWKMAVIRTNNSRELKRFYSSFRPDTKRVGKMLLYDL